MRFLILTTLDTSYTLGECVFRIQSAGKTLKFSSFFSVKRVKLCLMSRICSYYYFHTPLTSVLLRSFMSRESLSIYAKGIVILVGGICFVFGLAGLTREAFSLGFLLVLTFSVFVAPRMSLALPRSR